MRDTLSSGCDKDFFRLVAMTSDEDAAMGRPVDSCALKVIILHVVTLCG